MRDCLFCGKRVDNDEWVEGYFGIFKGVPQIYVPFTEEEEKENEGHIFSCIGGVWYTVIPETVGQYTGMNEFILTNGTCDAPLFEGDIVEVWGWRTVYGRSQSQYDHCVKVRGVIYFSHGEWKIDYDNDYNKSLEKLKGSEVQEREVSGASRLYFYGCHRSNKEEYRVKELEWHRKFHANDDEIYFNSDIMKLGNIFDNTDLLEG